MSEESQELDNQESVGYTDEDAVQTSEVEQHSHQESQLEGQEEPNQDQSNSDEEVVDPYSDDPYKALAERYGWNPEKGDKSPKEFIEYPFDKKIKTQQRYIQNVEDKLVQLTEMLVDQNKSKNSEDIKYLEDLYENSDDPREIRQAKAELDKLRAKEQSLSKYSTPESTNTPPRETMDFLKSHVDWFPNAIDANARLTQKQVDIQQYAINRENQLKQSHPGIDMTDMYDIIESEVINKFERPTKRKTKVTKPGQIKPGKGTAGSTDKYDKNTLNDFDKRMYTLLVDSGKVEKKDFFEQIKNSRG